MRFVPALTLSASACLRSLALISVCLTMVGCGKKQGAAATAPAVRNAPMTVDEGARPQPATVNALTSGEPTEDTGAFIADLESRVNALSIEESFRLLEHYQNRKT